MSQTTSVIKKVAGTILYMHQTGGTCAGVCENDRTHQMEKTVHTEATGLELSHRET